MGRWLLTILIEWEGGLYELQAANSKSNTTNSLGHVSGSGGEGKKVKQKQAEIERERKKRKSRQ